MQKTFKVQAAAQLLNTTVDSVRRTVEDSGILVERNETGPRTRQFTLENIFDLAAWRQAHRSKQKPLKRVIATVYAPKGGVGKTTITSNLACLFSLMGVKPLVIDLDFQANLTMSFGYDPELTLAEAKAADQDAEKAGTLNKTVAPKTDTVVERHFGHLVPGWIDTVNPGRSRLADVIKKPFGENGPHLIPGDLTLDRLDTILTVEALHGQRTADTKIAAMLKEGFAGNNPDFDLRGYDLILFDAAPAKNRITRNALLASDFVISPVSMEKYSTKAISYLSSVLQEMRTELGRSPELIVVGNFHTPNRMRVINQLSVLSNEYPGALLDAIIRRSEEFPKTLSADEDLPPLALAKPGSEPAEELRAVAKELLVKLGVFHD